jgi:hypothetical protein
VLPRRSLVALVLTAVVVVDSWAGQERRRLTDPPSTPIPELLRPGDKTVILDPGFLPPLVSEFSSSMPAADLLRAHAQAADWVVMGPVVDRQPHLTADQTWIMTSVRIEVGEQLKPRGRSLGTVIEIEEQGGSVELEGVNVTAVAEWQQRLVTGETYLLFITRGSRGATVEWSYRINAKKQLESTFQPFIRGETFDTAHGMSLERLRNILRGVV